MTGKILIVDDVATNRIVLKVKLGRAFHDTIQAATGAEALRLAREHQPKVVLLDLQLPDMTGLEVCAALKTDPHTRGIAVVMISAAQDAASRLAALEAGADDYLVKPLDEVMLLARLRSLLRARAAEGDQQMRAAAQDMALAEPAAGFDLPGRVALVPAGRVGGMALKTALAPHLRARLALLDRADALAEDSGATEVFLIVAEPEAPAEGLRLLSELRARPATSHAAICLMMPDGAADTAAMALDLGASDVIFASAPMQEVALRLAAQIRQKRESDRIRARLADGLRLSVTDALTGLHNRRYALPALARIAERAAETGRTFAVMLLDLDRFKAVNDTWGHAVGDLVLTEVAGRLRAGVRPLDLVARLGGEEFLVALPDVTVEQAHRLAERLRRQIYEEPVALPQGGSIGVTISIGLAMGGTSETAPGAIEELLHRADRALFDAKRKGRNHVTVIRKASAA